MARMNFNTLDRKLVDSVVGFEYDAGCWLARIVVEQMQITDGLSNRRVLAQLEFDGFSKVGTNALGSIRTNVPRYQPLRQPTMTPSRFGNYD
jgi:LPS-assembly protein